ncbi:NAD-dependent epimerase/dehydratase family protein [Marinicella litoralis]|uniref:Dihydroflavonol-4-reductase n=1 Tax=Marinicella litoralis TaxID=644220 RepID=A0A4R6XYX9_9GAMM|nr:NAD-dependent epimerase/dehydratase family protein [Marinicella litoralis]TDR23467.1 dihydroflavonol-4-reductase [Marinicella litoralis]
MSKTAFVTGSTGFLGRHLCHQLVQADWQVTAMCRSIPENALKGVNYVQADLLDMRSLMAALPKHVDCLFHTAADTNTWNKNNTRQSQTNIHGTQNLLDAAKEKGLQKWLHVSSITTFGVDHHGMIELTEQAPMEGLNSWVNYVKTKSQAEQMVIQQATDLPAVVVNPTHIIGVDDQHNWIRLFKMLISDTLPTIPIGAGSFADVKDVARGCILAAEKGLVGEKYILGGSNLSFEQFIDQVADGFGITVSKRRKPQALIKVAAKIQSAIGYLSGNPPDLTPEALQIISDQYSCSSQKAKDELGYTIRPFDETLQDIKANLIERGILSA